MLLETEIKLDINKDVADNELAVIIILEKNILLGSFSNVYDIELMGKKAWEWVALACEGFKIKRANKLPEEDILKVIKPLLTDSKYTAVFYGDTPLLERKTVLEIVEFVKNRGLNVLTLERGYIFDTEFIKKVDAIQSLPAKIFSGEDFFMIDDLRAVTKINEILKDRIISFHEDSGVIVLSKASTFIDADVIIESGTIVAENNTLKGATIIGKNCYIGPGNYIVDSIVQTGARVIKSAVIKSKISSGKEVVFEKLESAVR